MAERALAKVRVSRMTSASSALMIIGIGDSGHTLATLDLPSEAAAIVRSAMSSEPKKYEEQDLNLHTLRYRNLNPARLPFRHPRVSSKLLWLRGVARRFGQVKAAMPKAFVRRKPPGFSPAFRLRAARPVDAESGAGPRRFSARRSARRARVT